MHTLHQSIASIHQLIRSAIQTFIHDPSTHQCTHTYSTNTRSKHAARKHARTRTHARTHAQSHTHTCRICAVIVSRLLSDCLIPVVSGEVLSRDSESVEWSSHINRIPKVNFFMGQWPCSAYSEANFWL